MEKFNTDFYNFMPNHMILACEEIKAQRDNETDFNILWEEYRRHIWDNPKKAWISPRAFFDARPALIVDVDPEPIDIPKQEEVKVEEPVETEKVEVVEKRREENYERKNYNNNQYYHKNPKHKYSQGNHSGH